MQLAVDGQKKAPARVQMEHERRRLGQIRKAFVAAVEKMNAGEAIGLEFLCACVDYIKAAMDRLHDQDQRIHDLLLPVAVAPGAAAILAHLNARLAASRGALQTLVTGAEHFRRSGGREWATFRAAIEHFMDVYLNTLLNGQHSTLSLQDEHFGLSEWNQVAGVSNTALQTEAALFALVCRLAPAGTDPRHQPGGPPTRK